MINCYQAQIKMEGPSGRNQQSGAIQRFYKKYGWAKEKPTTEVINNKLLLGTDKDGRTSWHYAAEWDNSEVLQKLWESAKENLTTKEINNKFLLGRDKNWWTAWHCPTEWGNSEILQKIWE